MFPTLPADLHLLILFNQEWRSAALDFILPLFSSRTALFVILAVLIVWRSMRRGKGQVLYFILLVLVMGVTDFSCNAVKHQVGRVRPEHCIAGTWLRGDDGGWRRLPPDFRPTKTHGTSFPSSHAANSAALATLAVMLWPCLRKWLWSLPLLVGWSRLYLGKHFPTDVLAGWLFGLIIGWLFWRLWRYAARRLGLRLRPEEADAACLSRDPPPLR